MFWQADSVQSDWIQTLDVNVILAFQEDCFQNSFVQTPTSTTRVVFQTNFVQLDAFQPGFGYKILRANQIEACGVRDPNGDRVQAPAKHVVDEQSVLEEFADATGSYHFVGLDYLYMQTIMLGVTQLQQTHDDVLQVGSIENGQRCVLQSIEELIQVQEMNNGTRVYPKVNRETLWYIEYQQCFLTTSVVVLDALQIIDAQHEGIQAELPIITAETTGGV